MAPADVVEARIAARVARAVDASDATVAITRAFAATESPWPTAAAIDTVAPTDEVLAATLARLGLHVTAVAPVSTKEPDQ